MSTLNNAHDITSVGFITEPKTIEDLWHNAKFQSDNVSSWIYLKDAECAQIKLQCAKEALDAIIKFQKHNPQ